MFDFSLLEMSMIRNIARSVSKQRTLRLFSKLCLQCSNTTRYFLNLTKNEQISTLDQFLDSSPANDRIQNTNTTENLYKNIYKEIGYKSPFSNIENSLILQRLTNETNPMPPTYDSPMIHENYINMIAKWIQAGAINN